MWALRRRRGSWLLPECGRELHNRGRFNVSTSATYTPGHSAAVTAFMARRTAETHAAFILPRLQPSWRILDVGCGPGSITVGLATRVPDGEVLGCDVNAGQLEAARTLARERAVKNVRFEVGALDGAARRAGGGCDLVFAHAVFEHLAAPEEALRTLRGCLHPGGLIALRSPDWGGFVVEPYDDAIAAALAAYERLQQGNGGDTRAGRKLARWLAATGFTPIERSASYEIYDDPVLIGDYLAAQLAAAGELAAAATLRAWARQPGALFAQAWFEAIGCNANA